MVRPRVVGPRVPSVPVAAPLAVRRSHRAVRPTARYVVVPAPPAGRRVHRAVPGITGAVAVNPPPAESRIHRAPHQQTVQPVCDRPLISWYRKRKRRSFTFSC